jgi:hypothetical protein
MQAQLWIALSHSIPAEIASPFALFEGQAFLLMQAKQSWAVAPSLASADLSA